MLKLVRATLFAEYIAYVEAGIRCCTAQSTGVSTETGLAGRDRESPQQQPVERAPPPGAGRGGTSLRVAGVVPELPCRAIDICPPSEAGSSFTSAEGRLR